MRGLRTIPVMIAMGDEMAERCPDGLLLNYTNPMAMVPWGIWAGSAWPAERTIGVCHSVRDTHAFLAETVGVPEERVEYLTAGFNHQCFVYVFRDRETGEDLYPRLRAIVEADPDGLGRRVRVELFRRFGYFPTESSEHSSEYVPWFLHLDDQAERFRAEIDEYVRRSDENLAEWAEMRAQLDAGEPIELERNDELASQIVVAIETGEPVDVYGNVRNDGLIDGLPDDACVEVPMHVDADGATPSPSARSRPSASRSTGRSSTSPSSRSAPSSTTRATTCTTRRCSTRTRPRRSRPSRSSTWLTNCSRRTAS